MMLHVANNMPKEYDDLARHFEREMMSKNDPLSYEIMIPLLCADLERKKANQTLNFKPAEEMGLKSGYGRGYQKPTQRISSENSK